MKFRKRFLSLLIVFLLVTNHAPLALAAEDKILTINGNIIDAITDVVEYGWNENIYRFPNDILNGIEEGDEVYLVADIITTDALTGGSTINIELSNFRLEGANAKEYLVPEIPETIPIQKQIHITKKTIKIAPEHSYIYFGQNKPNENLITNVCNYDAQVINNDEVNISATFQIEEGDYTAVGDYSVSLQDVPNISGTGSDNYDVILDPETKFSILAYETDQTATSDGIPDEIHEGITYIKLHAPEDFLICKSNDPNGEWKESIDLPLTETHNTVYTYYLRNNNSSDTEYYQAISGPKTYEYTFVQTMPTVKNIKIEKDDPSKVLNFMKSGVFSNGKVTVTVFVEGGAVAQDTTIYLGEEGNYESQIVPATSASLVYGKTTYTATFEYDVNEGESITKKLKTYAENSCGEGDEYPTNGTNDTFVGTETKVDQPLTIDKKIPEVEITKINGNYKHYAIKAEFSISDSDSGIAKVEYLWDDGFKLNLWDSHFHNDYVELNDFSSNKKKYELVLPWSLSKSVPKNQHTLHLRVTDHAGNVFDDLATDTIGSDMLAPKFESIEIRKLQSDSSTNSLKFLPNGTFYSDTVEIAIKVNDNESEEEYYASGVNSVKVNDRTVIKNEESNEYVLIVSADDIINGMSLTVEDGIGLTTEALATEIPMNGAMKSNDLFIENDAPTIDFGNILDQGHKDNKDNIWFGSNDKNIVMKIIVSDNQGTVQSGLGFITIKDNNKVKYTNKDFSFKTTEHIEVFKIDDLEDGKHVFTVEVEDNCGNTYSDSITFYKDTKSPEKGSITTVSPKSVSIDNKQWFNKDELITFRVDASDPASGLKNISLKINDKEINYDSDYLKLGDKGYYVFADTSDIGTDSEHRYTVTGTVTDFANNILKLDPITVYIDFENPTINRLTAQKKSDIYDQNLNVLPFGVYSNDSLILKIYANDMWFDSGINYATVQYPGLIISQNGDSEGVFTLQIPASDSVFANDINITVYDKYGKPSVFCPNISNTDGNMISHGRFVMIEKALPTVSLSLPASDSIVNTDGQVWYNSNKVVVLKVQDINSGINNIELSVNGVDVPKDKNGVTLLKRAVTESADARNNAEQTYTFDTDYFTSMAGEAKDGKYVINVIVKDNAGNVANYNTIYNIDKMPPVIDRIDFTPKTIDGLENTSEFIQELKYGFYFKTEFNVVVNVTEVTPSSGFYEIKYRFVPYQDGKKREEIIGSQRIVDGKAILNVPKEFKGQIFVEAYDAVLNCNGEKTALAYVVDNSAPDIQITKNVNTDYHDAVGNSLYVETNSFTVVITDSIAGIKQIGYIQSAEQNPYERKIIDLDNTGYNVQDDLGDGWIVTGVDVNLVTQVTKTFTFPTDDNDVILTFDATDNSQNMIENVKSERFTVDKTAPIINVVFRDDDDTDAYYNQNRVADITVIDRNFDANLIKVMIVNTFGSIPTYSFTDNSFMEHTAAINFDEGDYTFELTGTDLGNHVATVQFSGGNENWFYVDKTKPVIVENFSEFSNSAENSFKVDKTVNIKITEHNFTPELVNLKITRKESGSEHSVEGLEDVTSTILGGARWNSSGDIHTISITFDRDGVYAVEMRPVDLASNSTNKYNTVIFEIDKTKPVVRMKNGSFVAEDDTEFLDIYPYARKDAATPTVEFDDLNISFIKYVYTVYIPDYSTSDLVIVRPKITRGTVEGNKYTLPDFTEDGVYAIELTAVDVAGNESELNLNTYARMINQDVLAFIMESNVEKKTGLFSLEYENGDTISKKPLSFDDLKILIMSQKDTPISIVLRDSNGKEILTNAECTIKSNLYGIEVYNYLLKSDFFKENFQDDTDMELRLTVKNQGYRIDLGKMHIDNIAPTCDIPKELASWHWFFGEDDRTFTLSNISELIDENSCKIYNNGVEIPFIYSSYDNTISFTLDKGWHNVGIVLEDMAGNINNIQERINIHIGYFWLWVIVALSVSTITVTIGIIIYFRKKKKREIEEV